MSDLPPVTGSTTPQSAGPLLFHPDVAADGGAVLFLADVAETLERAERLGVHLGVVQQQRVAHQDLLGRRGHRPRARALTG